MKRAILTKQRLALSTAGAVLLGGAITLSAGADNPSRSETALRKSEQLTEAPAPGPMSFGRAAYLETLPKIRGHADGFKEDLPLPAQSSLEDVGFEAAAAQGGTSSTDLEFVMQYNARCDWYRVALEDPQNSTAVEIIRDIPQWPAFRAGGPAQQISQRIAEAVYNGDLALLNEEFAVNCSEDLSRATVSEAEATELGEPTP